jgi:hypothetical protein
MPKTLLLAAAVLAALPATAAADERTCRGALGAVQVDNLRVPDGATCTLTGTRVQGTVKVEGGAVLRARAIKVAGNVQAENHRRVTITGRRTHIDGSVQIKQGGAFTLARTFIGSDVQVFTNRGAIVVRRNTIDGNLQCKENVPAPTGSGNVVHGNKEDQCSRL